MNYILKIVDMIIPGIFNYAQNHTEYKWYISDYYINQLLKEQFKKLIKEYRKEGIEVYSIYCEYGDIFININKNINFNKFKDVTKRLIGVDLPTTLLTSTPHTYINADICGIPLGLREHVARLKQKVRNKLLYDIRPVIAYMEPLDKQDFMLRFKHIL